MVFSLSCTEKSKTQANSESKLIKAQLEITRQGATELSTESWISITTGEEKSIFSPYNDVVGKQFVGEGMIVHCGQLLLAWVTA